MCFIFQSYYTFSSVSDGTIEDSCGITFFLQNSLSIFSIKAREKRSKARYKRCIWSPRYIIIFEIRYWLYWGILLVIDRLINIRNICLLFYLFTGLSIQQKPGKQITHYNLDHFGFVDSVAIRGYSVVEY